MPERRLAILVGEHNWGATNDPNLKVLRSSAEDLGVEFVNVWRFKGRSPRPIEIIDNARFSMVDLALGEVTRGVPRTPLFFGYIASRNIPHLLLVQHTNISGGRVARWAEMGGLKLTIYTDEDEMIFYIDQFLSESNKTSSGEEQFPSKRGVYEAGDLRVDDATFTVTSAGREIPLTPNEYSILRTLIRNKGIAQTHSEIITAVWGENLISENPKHLIRSHMQRLRARLADIGPDCQRHIITQGYLGYMIP